MEHRPLMLETTRLLAARLLRHAAGGAMDDGPALVVVDGADRALRLPLMGGGTIGRGPRAALRLRDAEASRLHAVVRERGGWLEIDDLGSKNGVVLNGRRIERPQRLRDGDRVRIGASTLEARGIAEMQGDAPSAPAIAGDGPAPDGDRGKGASVRAAAAILLAAAVALALAA